MPRTVTFLGRFFPATIRSRMPCRAFFDTLTFRPRGSPICSDTCTIRASCFLRAMLPSYVIFKVKGVGDVQGVPWKAVLGDTQTKQWFLLGFADNRQHAKIPVVRDSMPGSLDDGCAPAHHETVTLFRRLSNEMIVVRADDFLTDGPAIPQFLRIGSAVGVQVNHGQRSKGACLRTLDALRYRAIILEFIGSTGVQHAYTQAWPRAPFAIKAIAKDHIGRKLCRHFHFFASINSL